ncbi:MAG TPA: PKD domain-containing protein [Patescibacteria group bacterium]
MNKKILLLGFTIAILLAIPLTLGLLSQQTHVPIKAQKSSTLSFSQLNGPVTVGQKFNLDILLDPGQNTISFVKMVISYNPAYLSVANGGGFIQVGSNQYSNQFTVTLDGPTYDETSNKCTGNTCNMTISMGINPQSGTPLTGAQTTIASISFNPIAAPQSGSTNVSFSAGTQVLSLASQDQPSENVLSSSPPTTIQIVGPTPTMTPAPTSGGGGGGSPTNTPAPTSGGGGGGGASPTSSAAGPVCNSLTADNTSTASAPLSSIFTLTGSSSTSTINKVTFNFGDGTVQDVTSGGGLGTASVNAQINHTYQTNGVFTATATLTDANGNTSVPSSCSQAITVGSNPPTATTNPGQPTAQPTIPKTGPGDVIVGAGIIGAILAVAGIALFVGAL